MKKYNFIGFWKGFCNEDNFLKNGLLNYSDVELSYDYDNLDILIIGPAINENEYNLILNSNSYKIIYISEPIERFEHYKYIYSLYIENKYDLITGCINNDINKNRYKYPLYLMYFNYKDSKNIFNNVNDYVKSCNILNKDFATLINTHDQKNTRTELYQKIKDIGHITCPSNLFNNCSNEELNNIGNVEYIKKFKYNICSENCTTNIEGYITEKLLNCCLAGSIPIYCGSFDEIDTKIFNKNRILFYDHLDPESIEIIKNKIIYFRDNEDELIKFYRQDVFRKNAHLEINYLENSLINKIKNI